MRIAILSPIHNSLYSRLVAYLCVQESDIQVAQIVVRRALNWKRIQSEIRRDGPRLLKKVHQKLILGRQAFPPASAATIQDLAQSLKLPGKSLYDLGKRYGIPVLTVNDHNDPPAEKALSESDLDAIVFTGGGLIRKNILAIPRIGVINCHAGLLPRYRGMDVVEWAALEAETFPPATGLTLHLMDKGVDTGPILKTLPLPLAPGETIESLRIRIEPEMVHLVMAGLRGLRDGLVTPSPQENDDGQQYFVMHPRIKALISPRLSKITPNDD